MIGRIAAKLFGKNMHLWLFKLVTLEKNLSERETRKKNSLLVRNIAYLTAEDEPGSCLSPKGIEKKCVMEHHYLYLREQ